MTAYMHTINKMPARYLRGSQIVYTTPKQSVTLVRSLSQIRKEQAASMAWREKRFGVNQEMWKLGYGWQKVKVS